MITVTTNRFDYIEIAGHAGYAPHGSDIVCASVSVLYETFKALHAQSNGFSHGFVHTDDGDTIRMEMENGGFNSEYLEFFITGIEGIAEAYPDNVKLIDR